VRTNRGGGPGERGEDSYGSSARRSPRCSDTVQSWAEKRTPWRIAAPGVRRSGGSTQAISPRTWRGAEALWNVISSAVPGASALERRSIRPPRLMSSATPWSEGPSGHVGRHVTWRATGRRTPACGAMERGRSKSRRAWAWSELIRVKTTPWGMEPVGGVPSPTQTTSASTSMGPRSVRRRMARDTCGQSRSASSTQAPPSLRLRVQPAPTLLVAGLFLVSFSGVITFLISLYTGFYIAGPLYRFARNLEIFIEQGLVAPIPTREKDQLKQEEQLIKRSSIRLQNHYGALRAATDTALSQLAAQQDPSAAIAQLKELERAARL